MEVIKVKPAQSEVEKKEKSLVKIEPPKFLSLLIGWILLF